QLVGKTGEILIKCLDNQVIDKDDLIRYQKQYNGERAQGFLALKAAEAEKNTGKLANARFILNEFVQKYPNSRYATVAKDRINDLDKSLTNQVNVGVLLPFEDNPDISNAIYSGIEFAVKKLQRNNNINITLIKADCRTTVLDAIEAAEKLASDYSIIGIIGPLGRDQSSAVSLISKQYRIPTFSPTAEQSGIASLSEFFYQLSPDNYTKGTFIAEYAIGKLNLNSFAVMNAASGKSYEIAQGFMDRAELLGAKIVTNQIYYEGFNSLRDPFNAIRNAGIKKMFADSLIAELPDIEQTEIDSLYKLRMKAVNELAVINNRDVDSSRIEITSIDGIFLPISLNDNENIVAMMTNTYAGNFFKMQVFGNEDWLNENMFKNPNQARIMEGLTVFTSYYLNQNDPIFKNYLNDFRTMQQVTPEHFHTLGYRVGAFVFSGLQIDNNSRDVLNLNLSNKDAFETIGGRIDFNYKERVNSGTRILRLENGAFKVIE
ncbi:MAG: ABC transporter substrate-binding protein, partial [Calditrichaeota bacterium]|nr:ABC transporter substrate-binding protein [Calditrichota bacterium]